MGRPHRASPSRMTDHLGVLGVGAVREVEARDVHAGLHETIELVGRAGGGTDRADDLRSTHTAYLNIELKNCPV